MSKQFVVETLICANCTHFRVIRFFGEELEFCTFHDKFVCPHLPRCSDFDGQPLLEVGRTPKGVISTEMSYLVI